ncbi:MAG: hypothetical protein ACRC92_20300 [Peptostreptococcaceae bacterium]
MEFKCSIEEKQNNGCTSDKYKHNPCLGCIFYEEEPENKEELESGLIETADSAEK